MPRSWLRSSHSEQKNHQPNPRQGDDRMNKTVLCTAILAIFSISTPAFSDEISDLKAEIAAQKEAAAAQKARLDALEDKLNNVQRQQATAAAAPPPAPGARGSGIPTMSFKQGEGLSLSTANGSVTLYGLIDVTYLHINHADANGDSVT